MQPITTPMTTRKPAFEKQFRSGCGLLRCFCDVEVFKNNGQLRDDTVNCRLGV